MAPFIKLLVLLAAGLASPACGRDPVPPRETRASPAVPPPSIRDAALAVDDAAAPAEAPVRHTASVRIEARSGSLVGGTITLTESGAAPPGGTAPVDIDIELSGVSPGPHGLHVHERGDCSDPKAESAGPHFDVDAHPHAGLHDTASHAGDLGNVTADANGRVVVALRGVTKLSLSPSAPNGVVGRAIVLHADPDDLRSQPSGNSGDRIGCGVIALDR